MKIRPFYENFILQKSETISIFDTGLSKSYSGKQALLVLKVIRSSTETVIWFTRLSSQHSRKLTVFITDVRTGNNIPGAFCMTNSMVI